VPANLAAHALPGVAADAAALAGETFDAIFVNAGATRPEPAWLDALRPGGRLLVPLTVDTPAPNLGVGWMLLVTCGARGWTARFTSPVGVFHCAGARAADESDALRDAFQRGGHEAVSALRRDVHAPDADCWLHGASFATAAAERVDEERANSTAPAPRSRAPSPRRCAAGG
jgi:protein-L-isoaspartate(D-aspartate) O-methyltransferase